MKQKKPLIIVAVIAVICAAAIGIFAAVKGFGLRKTPEEQFRSVLQDATDDGLDALMAGLGKSLDQLDKDSMTGKAHIRVDLGDPVTSLLTMFHPSLSDLKNAELDLDTTIRDTTENMTGLIRLNGADILSLQATLDLSGGKSYIRIPEISDAYFDLTDTADYSSADLPFNQETLQQSMNLLKELSSFKETAASYRDIALDGITEVERTKEDITASGVTESCTALTATLTGQYFYDTGLAALEKLADDEKIKNIVAAVDAAAADSYDSMISDLKDAFTSSEADIASPDNNAVITLYVKKNELHGIRVDFTRGDDHSLLEYYMPQKDGSFGYLFRVNADESDLFTMEGSGSIKDAKLSGSFDTAVSPDLEESLADTSAVTNLKIEVSDLDLKAPEKGDFSGTFTFSTDDAAVLSGYKLAMDVNISGKTAEYVFHVLAGSAEWGSVTLSFDEGTEVAALAPGSGDKVIDTADGFALQSELASFDFASFFEKSMEKAGLKITLSDLQSIIGNFM